jgi:glycosyltransferase involved in cell wall biosynthesis
MHILYLSFPGGGLETNVRVLAPALAQAGHRVSILYFDSNVKQFESKTEAGIIEYRAPRGQWHYYFHRATFGIGGLGRLARAWEFGLDLTRAIHTILTRERLDLVELPESFLPTRRLPVPFVMRLHSPAWLWRLMCQEPIPRTDALEIRMEAQTLASAAAITAPSRAVADYIARTCRVTRPIHIIPYPVDTEQFKPCAEISRLARNDKPMVLFVGRIEKRKGADTLMRAIPNIVSRLPDAQFLFAGKLSDELASLAATMPPQVKFLGVKPRAELVALYQQASVVVVPSQWDNSPNVIYEAMACGAPVVATRVGGIPELVEEGVTGLLVPPRDEDALAHAITTLLADSLLRERMGQRGRERAVAEFALDNILARTLSLYESVLDA